MLQHAGECSEAAIGEADAAALGKDAGVLVCIGGGKALDNAKAAAHEAGLPVPDAALDQHPRSGRAGLAAVLHDGAHSASDNPRKHNGPTPGRWGPFWTPITPEAGSLFHMPDGRPVMQATISG
ncbi:hypothetical protein VB636_00155, partial [Paracoccus sp. APAP_BH8]